MSVRVSMSRLSSCGLLGAHIFRCADDLAEPSEERRFGQLAAGCLGHAEVDDLRHRLAVIQADQNIGWLKIAMDDPLLMRVLHGLANVDEKLQALAGRQPGARRKTR